MFMKYVSFIALLILTTFSVLPAAAQKSGAAAKTEAEIRKFYDDYAEDLKAGRRSAIADRYDPNGSYRMGGGRKSLQTIEQVRDVYMNKWAPPKSFAWKDMSIEILSPEVALVAALFEWPSADGQVRTYSYTGVLVKRGGRWYIRLEDENGGR